MQPKPQVLLVEDDARLAEQVFATLERAKLDAVWVQTGTAALDVPLNGFSLVILDLMLPGVHGFDVLEHIRGSSDVPVLVLSGRNETQDKVRALRLGADDFLTKPFWPEELAERVHARMRRPVLLHGGALEVGALVIDVAARSVRIGRRSVALTRVEFDLLAALARRAGVVVSRTALSDTAMGRDREGGGRTLDVHVSRLRKKLGTSAVKLGTIRGIGYRLDVAPKVPAAAVRPTPRRGRRASRAAGRGGGTTPRR